MTIYQRINVRIWPTVVEEESMPLFNGFMSVVPKERQLIRIANTETHERNTYLVTRVSMNLTTYGNMPDELNSFDVEVISLPGIRLPGELEN